MAKGEKFEFQSEVKQLLDILVYSLYKHKDVFLRELISNAVDALNKVQFELLKNSEMEDVQLDLQIKISMVKADNKLIVEDTGIGMTKEELIGNIGTIAHSGTVEFLKRIGETDQKQRLDLIGKFGVGFYSSFMVAKEIHIYSKSYQKDSGAYLWKSAGGSTYSIEETVKKERGTRIELFLKKEEKEFLDKDTLRRIVEKHSKFVPFPITIENEKVESMEAIWAQPKSSLKEGDYVDFYKFAQATQEAPETYIHLSSDAPVQFNAILFVPASSLELLGIVKHEPGVDLFSKKILIQKASKEVMPEYLRFVEGVIDSEDIPLNISRETIQSDRRIESIKKHVVKKLLDHFLQLKAKDKEKFLRIWGNFQRHFKEGVTTDYAQREKIADLLLFRSSQTENDDLVDLERYVKEMAKDQKEIFYTTGMDVASLEKNPALEAFRKKGIAVLYLLDPLDEIVIDHLRQYKGMTFKLAESADIKLDDEPEAGKGKGFSKDAQNLVDYLKTVYGERVADVRLSRRLVDSACILVHAGDGPSLQMEKIMKMVNKDYAFAKKIFEVNPHHPLIAEMVRIHKVQPDSEDLKTLSIQLLDNMLLREGIVDQVDTIVPRIQDIMLKAARGI